MKNKTVIREDVSFKEFIEKISYIKIPYYQRNYVWEGKTKKDDITQEGINYQKLVEDISEAYINGNENYDIGSIHVSSKKDEENHEYYEIIDGQQRITSLIIMLQTIFKEYCNEEFQKKQLFFKDNEINQENFIYKTGNKEFLCGILKVFIDEEKDIVDCEDNKEYDFKSTIVRTKKYLDDIFNNKKEKPNELFYEWILEKITFSLNIYQNKTDLIKQFLNINSFSVQLEQIEIFYSILSVALILSHSEVDVYSIKKKIDEFINKYMPYNKKETEKQVMITFMLAFFNDSIIKASTKNFEAQGGFGKWLAFNKKEYYCNEEKAKSFTKNFIKYIDDINKLFCLFSNKEGKLAYLFKLINETSKDGTLWSFIQYFFICFHNYKNRNIYTNQEKDLDNNKINSIFKLFIMKILFFIIDKGKKLNEKTINEWLESSDKNTGKQQKEEFDQKINEDLKNLKFKIHSVNKNILELTYSSEDNGIRISGYNEGIKICLVLLECYLKILNNTNKDFADFFEDLRDSCDIEHLYPKNGYKNKDKFNKDLQDTIFASEESFLKERAKFYNLTLLPSRKNQSLSDKDMKFKLNQYSRDDNNENIFLTQSLAYGSNFYKDKSAFKELDPNNRYIKIENDVAWTHSKNNKDFLINLFEKVVEWIYNYK